jgi:tRNA modification GTPase
LKDGVDTVIAGKPNVGKSTLMNLLSGFDKSIVTSVAGTTRDVVEESVSLGDLVLNLSDTAGIRETGDEIERIGVDKAKSRVNSASLLLCVFDASSPLTEEDAQMIEMAKDVPSVAIINKSDLPQALDDQRIKEAFCEVVTMSAKYDEGAEPLVQAIKRVCAVGDLNASDVLLYNERQRSLTKQATDCITEAIETLHMGFTLDAVTVMIEEAIGFLCELTGERVTDEVIDKVFHRFCVGK